MGMSNSCQRIMRVLLLAIAFAAAIWSVTVLRPFSAAELARDVSTRIVADERFKAGALAGVQVKIEIEGAGRLTPPELMRASALVNIRLAEDALGRANSIDADRQIVSAERSVKSALVASPGDSFLWLMLYSVKTTRNGFDAKNLSYLDRSYATGPLEGWIALRRNRLALSVSGGAHRIISRAVSEFAELVDADFIEQAAVNLTTVGWSQRDRLLAALDHVDVASKEKLSRRLLADGIKVKISGVISRDEEHW